MTASTPPTTTTRAVDYGSSERRFGAIANRPGAVWLDSGNAEQGRYDIISANPSRQRSLNNEDIQAIAPAGGPAGCQYAAPDLFQLARQWRRGSRTDSELPFLGGVIGYLGYDINQTLERLNPRPPPATSFPVAWLGYYPWALVQDLQAKQAWLVADSPMALRQGAATLAEMDAAPPQDDDFALLTPWRSSTDRAEFDAAVARIRDYIHAGDCYQVNLARHFQARYTGSPWSAYRRLRHALPSPYSAYLNGPTGALLSHSPERLLTIDRGEVVTSPIKGTRPRQANSLDDRQQAEQLLNSAKDRAENLIIVDLLRNDLGRSCLTGSVRAERLFALESYANVHHLVSTIRGRLRPEVDPMDALKSAFPGGSITGAPKIRAMEIINELEPVARSAYCGSVFYYSNHGRLDSSITIRTVLADGEQVHCWGGGGIVADSNTEREYQEGLDKVSVLLDTLEQYR